ncbi:hypothetical protein HY045_01020 [Candidatus Woesebacteria bacterium]|nr:hypothetical protein [Candidatus Woesebacteria bacterium]
MMGNYYQVNDSNNFGWMANHMRGFGLDGNYSPFLWSVDYGLHLLMAVLVILVLFALLRFVWKKTDRLK